MPKTRKQSHKKTHKIKHKLNKHKLNKHKLNKHKNNKTKKQTISFAQKQKAMKLLKQAIKKHIFNIINAHKIQHKKQHGGGCKQCGGSKGNNNNNGNVNNQGNIFTRLWESFKKVIQRILELMGFPQKESQANATRISKKIHQEAMMRLNNNQNSRTENFHTPQGETSIAGTFANELMQYADGEISQMSKDKIEKN